MAEPIRLVVVRNPFDRRERDEHFLVADEAPTIAALVGEYLPADLEVQVAVNGDLVAPELWSTRLIGGSDQMCVMPAVGKSGGGILSAVLSIALMVVAPEIAGFIAGEFGGVVSTIVSAGIGLLGSALIGALASPAKPNLPGAQSYDNSPSYAWNPITTQEAGGAIARAYGRVRLYGNIIAGFIEATGSTGSIQTAHLLIDLGMGPYAALSDFKINDQPANYYNGVTLVERLGLLDQPVIPAFNDTRVNRPAGVKVVAGSPVVRDTVGADFDALEIVLTCPGGLYVFNDAGGLSPLSVYVAVEISADGGATWVFAATSARTIETVIPGYWSLGYWTYEVEGSDTWHQTAVGSSVRTEHSEGELGGTTAFWQPSTWRWIDQPVTVATTVNDSITLTGAQQQPIRRVVRVDNLTRGQIYRVRITNLSTDYTDSRHADDVYLAELNEVLYDDFQYPRTALVAIKALATDQLSGGITFSCLADAAIVRVWDGAAWSSAWSRNPAWVTWDILTQPVLDNGGAVLRYDGRDPSALDLAAFHAWAQWCDAPVPDGAGGSEPRCQVDIVFDTPTTAWEAALEVAGSARATLLMRGTTVTVVFDHQRIAPAQLFTVGNTTKTSFQETFLPMADRAGAIEVEFIDAAAGHQRDKFTVVNADVTEFAAQRVQLSYRGIRRASQAWREVMIALKRNELLRRSGQLGADVDALNCTVGDLIWVQDDVTRWGEGGRIVAGTSTTVDLDRTITLAAGKTYELKLRLADDTLLSRSITTWAGTVNTVTVATPFPSVPQPYDVWAIGEVGKAVKEFLVTDIGRDSEQRARLSLIEYNASLYNVDLGLPTVPTRDVSDRPEPPGADSLAAHEQLTLVGGLVLSRITLTWRGTGSYDRARVSWRLNGSWWTTLPDTWETRAVFDVDGAGDLDIKVEPVGLAGVRSPAAQLTLLVYGKTLPPAAITGFRVAKIGGVATAAWDLHPDLDVRVDGQVIVRWSSKTADANWNDGIVVGAFPGGVTAGPLPLITGTYMAKALDSVGNWSMSEAAFVVTEGMVTGWTTVATVTESPAFGGSRANTLVVANELLLAGNSLWDSVPGTIDTWDMVDSAGGVVGSGTYDFATVLDMATVATRRLEADITALSVAVNDLWDGRSGLIDDWGLCDGTVIDDCNAVLTVSTTNDNPAGSPVWGPWVPAWVGDFTCRAARFRLGLTSGDSTHNIHISLLRVDAKVPA